jgi:uncharacterized protein YoxC
MATEENLDGKSKDLKDLESAAKSLLNPLDGIVDAFDAMVAGGNLLNKNFGLARSRIIEMNLAFVDSAAGVESLGGNLQDVATTMSEIAAASNRNVIENEEVVANLYASAKVLNTTSFALVNNFKDVGYEASQIGVNLEDSIGYIQSVGLNAVTVMKDVSDNMSQMNRFQFEGGVQGLAKMAAQASMLRFDMKQTFGFADRMLKPENAINMAAAFQRLGVTAGNLIDPFALMNQSLNDPTGLNNSLARLGEKYTYFSEEAQAFKMNPEGVRILREIEEEANLASGSLTKSALAAADLDRRLSQVKTAGLKFANEEDKQYLANIAKMGEKGQYEVTLEDGTKKELQNLNQGEFDKLIKQQKDAPKTMEEIQEKQLGTTKSIESNVRAMRDKMFLGGVSSQASNIEGLTSIVRSFATNAQKMVPKSNEMREGIAGVVENIQNVLKIGMQDGFKSITFGEAINKMKETLSQKSSNMDDKMFKVIQDLAKQTATGLRGNSEVEKLFKEAILGKTGSSTRPTNTKKGVIYGTQTKPMEQIGGTTKKYDKTFAQQKQVNSHVDFGGTITIKVDAPPGVALNQKQLNDVFNSQEFKQYIVKVSKSNTKGKNQGVVSYG